MTPECNNWRSAPENIKEETVSLVNGNKKLLRSLLNCGFFLEIKNGTTTTLIAEGSLDQEEKEKLIDRAIRSDTFYHIKGFSKSNDYEANQEALAVKYGDITLDDAEKRRGYTRHRYKIRGKHRSITKGKGSLASFRKIPVKR
jgi:hypothetical protein